jgi:hypothetical protein
MQGNEAMINAAEKRGEIIRNLEHALTLADELGEGDEERRVARWWLSLVVVACLLGAFALVAYSLFW